MATLGEKITRVENNIAASLEAVAEMGAEVPASANSDNLPSLIRSIQVVKKMEYNASTNNWTVTYTDNTTSTVSGPAMFSGKYSDLTGKPSSFTPSAHNQAASTITGGTFAGQVVAKAGYQAPGTSLLRNTKLVASETTPTNEGEIFWTYG